jgi:Uma2 family endonuclease
VDASNQSFQEGAVAVGKPMSEAAYHAFVLRTMESRWELHDGVLVEKPGRTWAHGCIVTTLVAGLYWQLDEAEYHVFVAARARLAPATIYVPDVMVVPDRYGDPFRDRPDLLAIFDGPLPFVAEGWSPLEYGYDVDAKIPIYQQRGDHEIWRIHPFARTVTRWVRQGNGEYDETLHRGGVLSLDALPEVTIDLNTMFAF